ncbi:FAD/NAD(P)-binding domain-containing protein [Teratosphaeria nubilosa]|uniref:FAD/NAD(P)-binding domain-containing protein n=1 Tax=Teratosphaeria nubilosa TaxID=161662 RepID=A0A6G1KX01_9PEZI|nr:FAD/NAD(P)-binding domain-containing protein [Teratosphaeria nubilosa]
MASPIEQNTSPLHIVIIGAGLAGLSAAISCALGGHHVVVLEAARELAEIGAGLQITPNGSKVFQHFGIYDALEQKAAEPSFVQIRRYSDGKVLSRTDHFDRDVRAKYNAPFWDLHRVDVQRALANRAKELSVQVRLGSRVADLDFEKPSVKIENGEELQADLIVAADGLWSKSRERFLALRGQLDEPLPTGDLAYRIVLKLDEVTDPELRDWISNPSCQFWIGPNAHVVAYSLRDGHMFNIVLLVPDNLPANVARQPGSLDEMRKIFNGWDPVLNRFLDQVKAVDKWKLMHRPELESWISDKSNFVFIGDSCHPMLPYLAQGANSSIEDGAVLGNVLGAMESKDQLPAALRLYERLRKKRGETIVRETFNQRNDFHMTDGPEQRARDELMLSQLGKEIKVKFPSRWQCPEFQPWLYGYDAQQETAAALRESPLGRAQQAV